MSIRSETSKRSSSSRCSQLDDLAARQPLVAPTATRAVELARRSLPRMVLPDSSVCFTLRRSPDGPAVAEGRSVRYAAIVALGAGQLGAEDQRRALNGSSAQDLRHRAAADLDTTDLGDLAMVTWATAEAGDAGADALADLLLPALADHDNPPTVPVAWALTALLAAGRPDAARTVADRLLGAVGPSGLFPHWLYAAQAPRMRRHVGCFADQVYPVQALARFAAGTGDARALSAAQRCADVICARQGAEGQWWWHYDVRTGGVVEGYPVYSVHQAGMAPMALFDLAAAGGRADEPALARGLRWLQDPLEGAGPLIDETEAVVWRKVGRREPVNKAVRAVRSATTAVHPSLRTRPLDLVFRPGPVDRETRPYEAGWALYAWLRSST